MKLVNRFPVGLIVGRTESSFLPKSFPSAPRLFILRSDVVKSVLRFVLVIVAGGLKKIKKLIFQRNFLYRKVDIGHFCSNFLQILH